MFLENIPTTTINMILHPVGGPFGAPSPLLQWTASSIMVQDTFATLIKLLTLPNPLLGSTRVHLGPFRFYTSITYNMHSNPILLSVHTIFYLVRAAWILSGFRSTTSQPVPSYCPCVIPQLHPHIPIRITNPYPNPNPNPNPNLNPNPNPNPKSQSISPSLFQSISQSLSISWLFYNMHTWIGPPPQGEAIKLHSRPHFFTPVSNHVEKGWHPSNGNRYPNWFPSKSETSFTYVPFPSSPKSNPAQVPDWSHFSISIKREMIQRDSSILMTDLIPLTSHILRTCEYPSMSWTLHIDPLVVLILSPKHHSLYHQILLKNLHYLNHSDTSTPHPFKASLNIDHYNDHWFHSKPLSTKPNLITTAPINISPEPSSNILIPLNTSQS